MRVTHTYGTGTGSTQRSVCEKCGAVYTLKTTIVAINPKQGEGAAAVARQMIRAEKHSSALERE